MTSSVLCSTTWALGSVGECRAGYRRNLEHRTNPCSAKEHIMSTSQINPMPPEDPEGSAGTEPWSEPGPGPEPEPDTGPGGDPDLATPDIRTRPGDDSPLVEPAPDPGLQDPSSADEQLPDPDAQAGPDQPGRASYEGGRG